MRPKNLKGKVALVTGNLTFLLYFKLVNPTPKLAYLLF